MKRLLTTFVLTFCLMACGRGQQVIITCPTTLCPAPGSIQVSANPTSISVGSTSALSATAFDTTSTKNINVTNQCVWTSSNSAVLSVSGPTATGVSVGSATANCTIGTISGSTPVTISVANVTITYPACGTPPCILPAGVTGSAYGPIQFTCSTASPPCTWAVSSGNFNACFTNGNGALSSAGVLQQATGANVTTGVCTPTIQATDGASHTATVQVSLTNSTACTPGPPNYPCTPSMQQQGGAFAPVVIPFSGQSSSCSPGPYPACSGVDNTIVSDPEPVASGNSSGLYHNPMIRLTNAASGCGNATQNACPSQQNTTFFADAGGSSERYHWNTNSTRLSVQTQGQKTLIYSWNAGTMQATFLYSSQNAMSLASGNVTNFSPTQQFLFYAMTNSGDTGDGQIIGQWDTTSTVTPPAPTHVYNFGTSVNCLPAGATNSIDALAVSSGGGNSDLYFVDGFSTAANQNTGRYVAAYKVGSGCSLWNTSTGQITGDWGTTSGPMVCQNCILTTAVSSITVSSVGGGNFLYQAVVTSTTGFSVGDTVTISGASAYNGTYTNIGVGSSTQLNWTVAGGSAGSATGGTATDNTPNPGTFTLHSVNVFPGTGYARVGPSKCDATSVCYNSTDPYLWQIGTNKVWTFCPNPSNNGCSGHGAGGTLGFYSQFSTPYFASHPLATPGTFTQFPTAGTFCSTPTPNDSHTGTQNFNDLLDDLPLFGTTANTGGTCNYTYCTQCELFGLYTPNAGANSGVWKRFAHTYSGANGCFSAAFTIMSVSQDGKWAMFPSNMQGGLGCMNGASSNCTATTSCSGSVAAPRSDVFIVKLQ